MIGVNRPHFYFVVVVIVVICFLLSASPLIVAHNGDENEDQWNTQSDHKSNDQRNVAGKIQRLVTDTSSEIWPGVTNKHLYNNQSTN